MRLNLFLVSLTCHLDGYRSRKERSIKFNFTFQDILGKTKSQLMTITCITFVFKSFSARQTLLCSLSSFLIIKTPLQKKIIPSDNNTYIAIPSLPTSEPQSENGCALEGGIAWQDWGKAFNRKGEN